MAHETGIAGAGIELLGATGEGAQRVTGGFELGEALVELSHSSCDELGDEPAGRLAPVAKGNDLADLPESQPDRLRSAHLPMPAKGILTVEAVARRTPLGRYEHTEMVAANPAYRWLAEAYAPRLLGACGADGLVRPAPSEASVLLASAALVEVLALLASALPAP